MHSATGWTLSIIDIIIFTLSLRVDQISASFGLGGTPTWTTTTGNVHGYEAPLTCLIATIGTLKIVQILDAEIAGPRKAGRLRGRLFLDQVAVGLSVD